MTDSLTLPIGADAGERESKERYFPTGSITLRRWRHEPTCSGRILKFWLLKPMLDDVANALCRIALAEVEKRVLPLGESGHQSGNPLSSADDGADTQLEYQLSALDLGQDERASVHMKSSSS
jgi:hypothetical protein